MAGSAPLQWCSSLALQHRMRRHWRGALPAMTRGGRGVSAISAISASDPPIKVGGRHTGHRFEPAKEFPQFPLAIRQLRQGRRPCAAAGARRRPARTRPRARRRLRAPSPGSPVATGARWCQAVPVVTHILARDPAGAADADPGQHMVRLSEAASSFSTRPSSLPRRLGGFRRQRRT